MKITCLFSLLFCLFNIDACKNRSTHQSLNEFFAGIPVKENYDQWVAYISTHPYLGIDSTNQTGVYSSLKKNIKSHFPFPDSILVKILAAKDTMRTSTNRYIYHSILIEGVFGNHINSKKEARASYREIINLVAPNYRLSGIDGKDFTMHFQNGRNAEFPDCRIYWDFLNELGFYYVTIEHNQLISSETLQ